MPNLGAAKTWLHVAFERAAIGDRRDKAADPSGEAWHSTGNVREVQMSDTPETQGSESGIARKLIVPAAISAVGSLVGLLLTKRDKLREAAPKLRDAASDLPRPRVPEGGVGELAGDLRGKLDEVLGKAPIGGGGDESSPAPKADRSELQQRRRDRQERRDRRRQRSRR